MLKLFFTPLENNTCNLWKPLRVKLNGFFLNHTQADIKRKTLAPYEINDMDGSIHSHLKP